MPIPIKRIPHVDKSSGGSNFSIDYSFLMNNLPKDKRIVTASDEDAELLVRFWSSADKVSDEVYKVSGSKLSNEDI